MTTSETQAIPVVPPQLDGAEIFVGAVNSEYKFLPMTKSGRRIGVNRVGQVGDVSREVFAGIHIPIEWRAKIKGDLVVTRHPQGNLMLFTQTHWHSFSKSMLQAGMAADSWRRTFFGNAMNAGIDRSGFLRVPARLCQRAGLTDQSSKATLIGVGKIIEVWEPSLLGAVQERIQAEMDTRAIDCLVF